MCVSKLICVKTSETEHDDVIKNDFSEPSLGYLLSTKMSPKPNEAITPNTLVSVFSFFGQD